MRIFKVKKIKELIEESGSDKDFMESEWANVDDLNKRLDKFKFRNPKNQYERAWNGSLETFKITSKLNKVNK